jgi:hypothetical protein
MILVFLRLAEQPRPALDTKMLLIMVKKGFFYEKILTTRNPYGAPDRNRSAAARPQLLFRFLEGTSGGKCACGGES